MKSWQRVLCMIGVIGSCICCSFWLTTTKADAMTKDWSIASVPRMQTGSTGIFLPSLSNVANPSLAIDQSGGIHLAFEPVSMAQDGRLPVQYGYCSINCLRRESWQIISVGDAGLPNSEVRLALTASGKPRIIWFAQQDWNQNGAYVFASCERNCTHTTNWQTLPIATAAVGASRGRYFALDAQGNPHFLYTSTLNAHEGTFYRYCLNACLSPQSWHEQKISDNFLLSGFSLAFDPENRLRLVLSAEKNYKNTLVYVTCDSECTSLVNWQSTGLLPLGDDGNLSLRLDAEGHPRLAVYIGDSGDSQLEKQLYYLWCNTECQQATNWSMVNMGLNDNEGGGMDLALDDQARPHFVIATSGYLPDQIDYIYCSSRCDTDPVWQRRVIENAEQVSNAACNPGVWYIGERPAIAWTTTGGLLVVHGVEGKCLGSDTFMHLVRLVDPGRR